MKLRGLIDEKFGLPGNAGREFGEKYMREFVGSGRFAELWTAFEATYPEMQPTLAKTFEKTNDLLRYIKPEKGDETYRVSSIDEPVAQELNEYLDNILAAIDELANLDKVPDQKTVSDAIQYFDGLLQDMLNIFTSNTADDKPLKPYKQSNIGFNVKETEYGVHDLLKQHMDQIKLDSGPNTYRMLQTQLALGKDAWVESWLIKNGYMEEEKTPFEENIKLPMEKNAEEVAAKTKQIASKAGEELTNLAKDIYDTPTVKRLRAYIKKEVGKIGQKLVDKYAVDQPGKQIEIPFDKELAEEKPGLWANIRAKRKSGKPMAKKGSKAYKSAKKAGDKINKETNEVYYVDAVDENEAYCPVCTEAMLETVKEALNKIDEKKGKCKPSKGKRFAKRVSGKCRSYGQKGKAKKGGDRIRPGTAKGHAYCARSAKIKKCKNPPCANKLSRKKWKCQGSRSVPE